MKITGTHELGRWATNPPNGYPRFVSGRYKGRYVHRVTWQVIAGRALPQGWHVHHQDNDKLHFCGENLIAMPWILHPAVVRRCPWTGEFLSKSEWLRRCT